MNALLDKGANVDTLSHGRSPLFIAAKNGHLETVKALVNRQLHLVTASIINTAKENGHIAIAVFLEDQLKKGSRGTEPNCKNQESVLPIPAGMSQAVEYLKQ